jgi:hypothetical protein
MNSTNFEVICPHCQLYVIIEQINCGIFRHGVLKSNNEQINPHLDKQSCDDLVEKNLIYGCGKPFRIVKQGDTFIIEICDYI